MMANSDEAHGTVKLHILNVLSIKMKLHLFIRLPQYLPNVNLLHMLQPNMIFDTCD